MKEAYHLEKESEITSIFTKVVKCKQSCFFTSIKTCTTYKILHHYNCTNCQNVSERKAVLDTGNWQKSNLTCLEITIVHNKSF
jgi:RecA/RadA recombinase